MKLVIINYGSGNLHSVHKAFEAVNNNLENPYEIIVTNTPSEILNADKLVLPGVTLFPDESAGEAGVRVLQQYLGLDFETGDLELYDFRSNPSRDPRQWLVSVIYVAKIDEDGLLL